MNARELLDKAKALKPEYCNARNSMGCLEGWYDFTFAMVNTFTEEEILNMNEREIMLLEKLANSISEGLY